MLKGIFKKFKTADDSKKNKILNNIKRNIDPNTIWDIVCELGDGAFGKVYKVI